MTERKTLLALLAGLVVGAGGFALIAGREDEDDDARTATAAPQSAPAPTPEDTAGGQEQAASGGASATGNEGGGAAAQNGSGGRVDADRAGEIAAAELGGTVNRVYREDDFGASWEVEVNAPDGEYDVYVNAAGGVVRTVGPKPGD